jgi:hypothetical protein
VPYAPLQPILSGPSMGSSGWAPFYAEASPELTEVPWSPSLRPAEVATALTPTLSAPGRISKFVQPEPADARDHEAATMFQTAGVPNPSAPGQLSPIFTPVSYQNPAVPRPWWVPTGPFDPWAQNFMKGVQGYINFRRSRTRPRARDDDDDECWRRFYNERARCLARAPDMPHQDHLGGCIDRAVQRRQACLANGYPGGPGELREWGDLDEEVWINPDR